MRALCDAVLTLPEKESDAVEGVKAADLPIAVFQKDYVTIRDAA
jgi:hypothetical protein